MTEVIDSPYRLKALDVRASRGNVYVTLPDGIIIVIPVSTLGEPWDTASAKAVANVRLRLGGTWLFWDDIDEGIVLDEFLGEKLLLNGFSKVKHRAQRVAAVAGSRKRVQREKIAS